MKIVRRQEDLADAIKDKRVKEVFDYAEALEKSSNEECWRVFLKHADKFDPEDRYEVIESTEEVYSFDNEALIDFLNTYYGKNVSFQGSPDGERIYINNVEVDLSQNCDSNHSLTFFRTIDTFMIDLDDCTTDLEVYNKLMTKVPFIDWSYSKSKGITVEAKDGKAFGKLGSVIKPYDAGGEVKLVEYLTVETTLADKWMIRICYDCPCSMDDCEFCHTELND